MEKRGRNGRPSERKIEKRQQEEEENVPLSGGARFYFREALQFQPSRRVIFYAIPIIAPIIPRDSLSTIIISTRIPRLL